MVKALFLSLIGVALSADIDCSKATCQEACTCSLDKCASEIDTCMAAPNCASAQTCALACGCGDTACTLKCAAQSPSIKALPAAKCINSNCNIPPVALSSSADIDCSKATCEEACTCSLDKCASEIDTCMAAPNCASAQTCALACGCGDTACTLKCAAQSPSIKALPAAKCINSNCNIPPVALSSSADIDCSKATCEEACTCSLDKCASEIDTCMAAPNCASAQTCALACGCGDTACTLKCAAQSPSIKALPAAKCINSNCNIPPAALGSSADIDCSKATCEEACTCSLDKCASEIDTCMAAPNCASAQTCALACGCGDTACTLKCAAQSPSIKALPAAKCINSNCNIPPALKSSADVDCSKAACQADCECSLEQCASEIDACLAAESCAKSQDCALACPCSNDACILKCAASSPSIKALPVAKCINSKCDSAGVSV